MFNLNSGSENCDEESRVLRRPEDVAVNQLPTGLLDAFLHVIVGVVLRDVPKQKKRHILVCSQKDFASVVSILNQ